MTTLIKEGNDYCDNIEPKKMKEDRMNGVKSEKRDTSVEENLKVKQEIQGDNPSVENKKYYIKGKIDFQNANKYLRDPVFQRFTEEKQEKYPKNYHLFPCYNFAYPCIDSIEGITHAMRANEYSVRIPMQNKFNSNCFKYKASKKTNFMEWDKIYTINRNNLIDKRYFTISVEGTFSLIIDNIEDKVEEVEVDWHQKNKELGKRIQKRYNKLIIEKEDSNLLKEGQKLTLYKCGNSVAEKIIKEGDKVKEIHEKLTPEDKDFKKTTICHWVPMKDGLFTKAVVREYDGLITVKNQKII